MVLLVVGKDACIRGLSSVLFVDLWLVVRLVVGEDATC